MRRASHYYYIFQLETQFFRLGQLNHIKRHVLEGVYLVFVDIRICLEAPQLFSYVRMCRLKARANLFRFTPPPSSELGSGSITRNHSISRWKDWHRPTDLLSLYWFSISRCLGGKTNKYEGRRKLQMKRLETNTNIDGFVFTDTGAWASSWAWLKP